MLTIYNYIYYIVLFIFNSNIFIVKKPPTTCLGGREINGICNDQP
jgi:hypothetical protein